MRILQSNSDMNERIYCEAMLFWRWGAKGDLDKVALLGGHKWSV